MQSAPTLIGARFPRGDATICVFGESLPAEAPILLLFMDAFGPRPTLFEIASRITDIGWRVLLPDLFYDHHPFEPILPSTIGSDGEDRQRMMRMFGALDQRAIDDDVKALISFTSDRYGAVRLGAVGYCMGGRFALSAATLSPQVAVAASFHGSNLAPANDDGADRRASSIKGKIYVGVAEIDPTFGADEEARLAASFGEAGLDFVIETYEGAYHGFVMRDLSSFNEVASARHWTVIKDLLGGVP